MADALHAVDPVGGVDQTDRARPRGFGSAYLRYVVFIFFLANLLATMDRTILSILLEPIRKEFSLQDSQVGLLGFASAIFYALFGLLIGRLADTKSRSKLLALAIALFSVGTVLSGMVQNFTQLFLARVAVGVGDAGGIPTKYSLIGDKFRPEHRASALALINSGVGIGSILGLILAGILAQSVGWRMTFVLLGIPGALLALTMLLTIHEPVRGQYESVAVQAADAPSLRETIGTLASNRTLMFIVTAYSFTVFGLQGIGYWVPTLLIRSYHMPIHDVGVVYGSIIGAAFIGGMLVGATISSPLLKRDRRWEMWMPGIANFLVTICYFIAFSTSSLTVTLAALGTATFLLGTILGPASAAIQSTVTSRMRGVAVAITMFVSALIGQGVGPWAIGSLSTQLAPIYGDASLKAALQFTPLALTIGGVLYLLGARTFQRDRVD
ncbi:MAG: MFS transporter [Sphingomonas sp.]|nr:MFS transporter [Sphingomonas sp.]